MKLTRFEQGNCAAYQTQLSILPIPNKEFSGSDLDSHLGGKHVVGQLEGDGVELLPDEALHRFDTISFQMRFSIFHLEHIHVKRQPNSDNEQGLTEFEGN